MTKGIRQRSERCLGISFASPSFGLKWTARLRGEIVIQYSALIVIQSHCIMPIERGRMGQISFEGKSFYHVNWLIAQPATIFLRLLRRDPCRILHSSRCDGSKKCELRRAAKKKTQNPSQISQRHLRNLLFRGFSYFPLVRLYICGVRASQDNMRRAGRGNGNVDTSKFTASSLRDKISAQSWFRKALPTLKYYCSNSLRCSAIQQSSTFSPLVSFLCISHDIGVAAPKYDRKTHKYSRVYTCHYYFALFPSNLSGIPCWSEALSLLKPLSTRFTPNPFSIFVFFPFVQAKIYHDILFNFSIINYASSLYTGQTCSWGQGKQSKQVSGNFKE